VNLGIVLPWFDWRKKIINRALIPCKNYQNLEKKNNRLMEEMNKFSTCIEFVPPTLLAFLLQKGVIYIHCIFYSVSIV